jgi:hypothetical protein
MHSRFQSLLVLFVCCYVSSVSGGVKTVEIGRFENRVQTLLVPSQCWG